MLCACGSRLHDVFIRASSTIALNAVGVVGDWIVRNNSKPRTHSISLLHAALEQKLPGMYLIIYSQVGTYIPRYVCMYDSSEVPLPTAQCDGFWSCWSIDNRVSSQARRSQHTFRLPCDLVGLSCRSFRIRSMVSSQLWNISSSSTVDYGGLRLSVSFGCEAVL